MVTLYNNCYPHYIQDLRSDVKAMAGNMESAMLGHHKELSAVAANSQSRDQVRLLGNANALLTPKPVHVWILVQSVALGCFLLFPDVLFIFTCGEATQVNG